MSEVGGPSRSRLTDWLAEIGPDAGSALPEAVRLALALARELQQRASRLQTGPERRQQSELDRLLRTPQDKATLVQLTDQAFRARSARRSVDQFVHILDVQGVPRFFSAVDRTLLRGFQTFGGYLPDVAAPLVKERMQRETANVVLPLDRPHLALHLAKRRAHGLRMNVNILGEAILGESEAGRRLQQYLELLQWPEVEVVSVKISTLFSQISPLAREHSLGVLCDRLERLYRSAAHLRYEGVEGQPVAKFVYLDMEEYRDMDLTLEAFMRTLDRTGLERARAGIVLQAYLPDAFAAQQRLNAWARRRASAGGEPVTLRLVKGANMEMERVEASVRGWRQAPFLEKRDTDANYKRMVHEALRAENASAVRLAVASHNLFDVAYALVCAHRAGVLDWVHVEMLEGMANHQRRAVCGMHSEMLLYAPACGQDQFVHAIGYLVRRLDENTGVENFLRHTFKLEVGSPEWARLESDFVACFDRLESLPKSPRRDQNRLRPPAAVHAVANGWRQLENEPDTDFTVPANVQWGEGIVTQWQDRCESNAPEIALGVGGEFLLEGRKVKGCRDPSRPGVVVGRYREANLEDVDRAVACATADTEGWRRMAAQARYEILGWVAHELRVSRPELMGAAMANGGKILLESDPEVSESVDFVEFYRAVALELEERPGLEARGKGVVVVAAPWNFPIAIPCGGVAAALAAGNTVILKPASDTVLAAWELCCCFWRAGVPRQALQFMPCAGGEVGQRLVLHPALSAAVLTGGTETARRLLAARPDLNLLAETGGKNATIVTALADRDQAVRNVLQSAFSHSGQKCSATSLLLLESEVYDDPQFREVLCDAVSSLPVGSAWNLSTRIGPLIRPPSGELETALKTLEPGESWALMPEKVGDNPNLWSPGIKWGVRAGSFTHMTELFGPVLGVMRFETLEEAIDMVHQTGYGLTSGLESLDDREQETWGRGIRAGNLYINRPTTGAVVLRQPFGGVGKSAFGSGLKAGGPHYVAQLMEFVERPGTGGTGIASEVDASPPGTSPILSGVVDRFSVEAVSRGLASAQDVRRLARAATAYEAWHREEYGTAHDHCRLLGQDNLRRYQPIRELRIRVDARDSVFEVMARVCAARLAGNRITVSFVPGAHDPLMEALESWTEAWGGGIEFLEETDEALSQAMEQGQTDRVRYAGRERVPGMIWGSAMAAGVSVVTAPVLGDGWLELKWYLWEQSLSVNYHRYGNLGARAEETRARPL